MGSALDQAVLLSGLWAMARATCFASAAVAAPVISSVTTWPTPSPSSTIWWARLPQTRASALAKAGRVWSVSVDAAGSAGEQEDGVVGGGVAVDRDGVEGVFDRGGEEFAQ